VGTQPGRIPERVVLRPSEDATIALRGIPRPSRVVLTTPANQTVHSAFVHQVVWFLLGLFALGNVVCLALFVLTGFGFTQLSDVALGSLAAATIAEVAGVLGIVLKALV